MGDIQATFLATLIDEWSRAGVTDAVVCPGNRSTLLSALLETDARINVHVMVDERSAAYFALGLGKATGRPAVFWCTSGTATAQAHSALIEAHYAQVPLLVCTSNRPPELHHVRDWQSIDQSKLYEGMTRWSFAPGVADDAMRDSWRSIASRSVVETMHHPNGPGPVHLDLAIREPWNLPIDQLPPSRPNGAPWHRVEIPDSIASTFGPSQWINKTGVFVVGECDVDAATLYEAANRLSWPVLAEARSGVRQPHPHCITSYDTLLRGEVFATSHQPEIVVQIGSPSISKTVATWIQNSGAELWVVDPYDLWRGSVGDASSILRVTPTSLCCSIVAADLQGEHNGWLESWQRAEAGAQRVFASMLDSVDEVNEPGIARRLASSLGRINLFAATSMPVRDVESFSGAQLAAKVFANRGASGMEGLVSTAAGLATADPGRPTVLLVGDLSFLYDLNALWALPATNLTIVVIDNNGGGIFSTLPQLKTIDPEVFERVIATPQNVDIPAIVTSLGVSVVVVERLADLVPACKQSITDGGLRVVYLRTDRARNADLHRRLTDEVANALP
jgi:2-succinyl-5-enolpyruvyl-6-hydroxy-3-cyclohexene-1-carboxylate synthase